MEELTSALASSFQVSNDVNSTSSPHPRFSSYKQKTSNSDQESRRRRLLEIQKSNRFNFMSHIRKLTDDEWKNDHDVKENTSDNEGDATEDSMDVDVKLKKPGRFYKDQLMLSEWLVEVPEDFKTEWLSVLCPVAKRCLVVASRGSTKVFTKSGYRLNSFPSHLPGGAHRNKAKDSTILDCLYSEASRTYYVLDLMCWNGHPVYDSETEFRFYWLHEKFQEHSSLGEVSKINPFKFVPLPSFRCEMEDILTAVESAAFEIDGLLFFHKRSHYTFGSTPLVVWLKPYMLQEILGISVPERQMSHKPAGYTNYADHMKRVAEDGQHYLKNKGKPSSNSNNSARRRKKDASAAMNCEMHDEEKEVEECEEESQISSTSNKGRGKKKGTKTKSREIEMDEEAGDTTEESHGMTADMPT